MPKKVTNQNLQHNMISRKETQMSSYRKMLGKQENKITKTRIKITKQKESNEQTVNKFKVFKLFFKFSYLKKKG